MEKQVYELKISESLEHVMPPLQEVELNLLIQSLLAEGCRDPLVVWNGMIIDGHNRYRLCRENNIPFTYIEMDFEDEEAAKKWIIRNQLARRNVPDFVRCELVLPLEEELKAEAKKRQGQRNDIRNIPPNLAGSSDQKDSRDELAGFAGVSHGTLSKAKKLIAEADDETKEKLRNGEVSIHKAFTELKENLDSAHLEEQDGGPESDPMEKEAGRHSAEAKPGDIFPGFGVEKIPGQLADEPVTRQPDSVYDISPIEVYGNMPSDNLELRGNAELTHARSDLQSATEDYVRRAGEILRGMSTASTSAENLQILRAIVANGYDQIMDLINQKMNGGNEDEEGNQE